MNRRVEVMCNDGSWMEVQMYEVKTDDIFRMFEPTGHAVVDSTGQSVFVATTDAFIGQSGIWTVNYDYLVH